ncbi:Trp biosynthesis-associated membrane protein [Microbacterium sp. ARD32]|uniref:Trp biosynthesis-associated membrane protein n=1 Tax=Microbacterium sp. ARD32 TaxID=2962577 RepID=UPI0028818180|nr:Trp biosynthesis-associated membrane protein [Microbacterium sp. ARD32]MDT0157171.1 Trp biosynthesis-associated membrane protein [Microbacterium sp. ARD32]
MYAVVGFLIAGGIGTISATQTWIMARRVDAAEPLLVTGADAVPLLAALSLAVLALGAALSIAGRALRYVLAVLGLGAAAALIAGTLPISLDPPLSSVAPVLTKATGLSGGKALQALVTALEPTAWPVAALIAWTLLLAASAFVLLTAHRWKAGGRRYEQNPAVRHADAGPLDPVDSWDELSHGTDPTGPSR